MRWTITPRTIRQGGSVRNRHALRGRSRIIRACGTDLTVDEEARMAKIRIGVGAAGASSTTEALAELVKGLDELGFDSLWLSEVLNGPVLDTVVGVARGAPGN